MAPRSRTGCLTCRQRKLKCSEERPVCSQCIKANRECIPSSGITFRHQQNPSLNGANSDDGSSNSLKSFYGYKETFGKGVRWVAVPKELTFVHTSNPFQDQPFRDENGATVNLSALASHRQIINSAPTSNLAQYHEQSAVAEDNDLAREYSFALNHAAYPAYATHGLEALSAVASQDPYNHTYSHSSPPPATTLPTISSPSNQHLQPEGEQHDSASHPHDSGSTQELQLQQQHAAAQALSNQNLDYILNPQSSNFGLTSDPGEPSLDATSDNSNIDPRLQAALLLPTIVAAADPVPTGDPPILDRGPDADVALIQNDSGS